MDADRDARIIEIARSYLTEQDLKVANIGFRYVEDYENGYGHFFDGQEAVIVGAQAWLAGQVAGTEPLPPTKCMVEVNYGQGPTKVETNKYRSIDAPYGSHAQDVTSPEFEWGPENDDDEYTGLNIDDDCAVSELIAAVSYAYSWYSKDHDYEILEEESRQTFAAQFKELGLTPAKCARRVEQLEKLFTKILKTAGKHDRNEKMWC